MYHERKQLLLFTLKSYSLMSHNFEKQPKYFTNANELLIIFGMPLVIKKMPLIIQALNMYLFNVIVRHC